jgi:hypothetical protein
MTKIFVKNESDLLVPGRKFYLLTKNCSIGPSCSFDEYLGFYVKEISNDFTFGLLKSSKVYVFSKTQNDPTFQGELKVDIGELIDGNGQRIGVKGSFVPKSELNKIWYEKSQGGKRRYKRQVTKRRKSKCAYKKKTSKRRRY